MKNFTQKDCARRISLINQLSDLSRDGWAHAKSCDWEPLEKELRELEAKRAAS